VTTDLVPVDIDKAKVLLALGLNVNDPNAQAALLVCQRYDLDPLLKHVQLIKQAIYITRDGYLHVAHQSGVFDGMELDDEGETDAYYWAKVSVWRRDMTRPFSAKARCRKDEKVFGDPWDMAVTRAERRALKRAFDVSGLPSEGDYDEHADLFDRTTGEALTPRTAPQLAEGPHMDAPLPDEPLQAELIGPEGQPGEEDTDAKTAAQNRKLFALLDEAELKDKATRRRWAGGVLGRDVSSFSDLTRGDVSTLIDQLESMVVPT
jgi:hypothetical protein